MSICEEVWKSVLRSESRKSFEWVALCPGGFVQIVKDVEELSWEKFYVDTVLIIKINVNDKSVREAFTHNKERKQNIPDWISFEEAANLAWKIYSTQHLLFIDNFNFEEVILRAYEAIYPIQGAKNV